ncbi:MMPL family transporter, partial [bacterium]|nr:MMPL family transporter [bacterium]
ILPVPKKMKNKQGARLINKVLDIIGRFVIRFRHGFAVIAVLIVIIAVFGIPKVNLEMNPISFFPEDTEVVRADNMINEHLGGSINMNLLFEGNIQSVEIMNAMDSLQVFIEKFDEVGSTMSLATVVKKINKALNNNDDAYEVIPETDAGVAQAILMYSLSGEPDDFEAIVDNGYEFGQVIAMLKSSSTQKVTAITNKIHRYIKEKFPENDISIKTTGFSVFFKDLAHLIIIAQVRSITFAVILVFLFAWLTYRRFILGLLSIIPFAMCVIFNFSIMGFGGIDLSIPTAMMASMIIGIGVDFSFHLISRYKIEAKNNNVENSVLNSLKKVGEPILYSAFTTACGGMVLTVSGFIPVRFLGALLALIMLVCAFLALTVLPSLLTYIKTK